MNAPRSVLLVSVLKCLRDHPHDDTASGVATWLGWPSVDAVEMALGALQRDALVMRAGHPWASVAWLGGTNKAPCFSAAPPSSFSSSHRPGALRPARCAVLRIRLDRVQPLLSQLGRARMASGQSPRADDPYAPSVRWAM
jgi:hypothetical protein